MADSVAAPEHAHFAPIVSGEWALPKPSAYPPPPIADYNRPAEHALAPEVEPQAPSTLPERLTSHIAAWNTVAVIMLLAVFIMAATAGGFEIAHMALAVGLFVLAGTSGAVALLLGWDREPMGGRVKLLEEVVVMLLDRLPTGRTRHRG